MGGSKNRVAVSHLDPPRVAASPCRDPRAMAFHSAPSAPEMSRSAIKVVPRKAARQLLFRVDVSRPLGMTIDSADDERYQCKIIEIVEGGQADVAGVEAGMVIIGVNYESVEGVPHDEVLYKVRSIERNQESLVMELQVRAPTVSAIQSEDLHQARTWGSSRTIDQDRGDAHGSMVEKWGGGLFHASISELCFACLCPCILWGDVEIFFREDAPEQRRKPSVEDQIRNIMFASVGCGPPSGAAGRYYLSGTKNADRFFWVLPIPQIARYFCAAHVHGEASYWSRR